MSAIAVELHNVSKIYQVYDRPHLRMLEILTRHRKSFHFTSRALENITLKIPKGSVFGIVGKNGSGKSTLLQIIASVLQPTTGTVTVNGRVSALLELGSGFNPDFTGIENIYLYGSILGISKEQMQQKLPEILAFAAIGDYIHLPTKTYSSGMVVRLAFATAVAVDPEILIVDEALSVGDAEFQHRCILRIREIIRGGATVIFVSHDIGTVKLLCERAILLDKGSLVIEGTADEVAKEYHRRLFHEEIHGPNQQLGSDIQFLPSDSGSLSDHEPIRSLAKKASLTRSSHPQIPDEAAQKAFSVRTNSLQFGTGEARIIFCELLDSKDTPTSMVDFGTKMTVRVYIEFDQAVASAVAGVVIRNSRGVDIVTTNTHIENSNLKNVQAGEVRVVDFSFNHTLRDDHYSVNPAVCDEQHFHQARPFHWIDNAVVFKAAKSKEKIVYSMFYPESMEVHEWDLGTQKPSLKVG